jgi:hypothetical protein
VSDFDSARRDLADARAAGADARLAAWQAAEERRAAAAAQAQAEATFDSGDPASTEAHERLAQAAEHARAEAERLRSEARRAHEAAVAALDRFKVFTDPRRNIGQLPDRSPVALLPVRVETRFADAGTRDQPRRQLWIRVYPDDCSIDTFEPTLSAAEVANAKLYWQRMWRAGGLEAEERAAWRGLVSAHGSGRAGFILDHYGPVNPTDKPQRAADTDEILVVATSSPPGAGEASALAAYWQAVWRADGAPAALAAATSALEVAVGAARAAELVAEHVPFNLDDRPLPPLQKRQVAASVAFLVLPPDPPPKQASWSQAPQVKQLPERFVALGYSGGQQVLEGIGKPVLAPLYAGPDPSADVAASIHPDGEDLHVPDELAWLVDFDKAVDAGMGLAIDVTDEVASGGLDRLLVLGIQMGTSDDAGKLALEELLHHHKVGRNGLSLAPQGTPTHNTAGKGTGYTRLDDPDRSFDERRAAPLFTPVADPMEKRDGQRVAEALGVDPALLADVHGAGGRDQLRARAMHRALWPATLGYWMDKMLHPAFDDDTVTDARWFFSHYVSGGGSVPALRIGGQPYGILPTTAFSRIAWLRPEAPHIAAVELPSAGRVRFLTGLLGLLREVDGDWRAMTSGAAHVGRPGDAHQTLLDIVGHHPTSVEYHWRYSESMRHLYNAINLWGLGPQHWQAIAALGLQGAGASLLGRLGYQGEQPDILEHAFMSSVGRIDAVVDDRPLSETEPVRPYTDDGRNYIRWLIDSARTSLDAVAAEDGFAGDESPQALLYLYLRHALQLGFYDTSYELHKSSAILSPVALAAMKPEPAFVHVDDGAPASESRYAALYKVEQRITQSPSLLIADYIAQNLDLLAEAAGLADQVRALELLADAPTAELERAFAGHVDCCSYRFDAWLLGLVNLQLEAMRRGWPAALHGPRGARDQAHDGVYLGAYAWLEDLRPARSQLEDVRLEGDLASTFSGPRPLKRDPENGGYVHAPSLPHARTAAVLRSGYLANATPASRETLAVNLSSDRVRQALAVLEGIRNGQSLGALLGYRLERGLHDAHGLAEVDELILPLRKAFPLVADSLTATKEGPGVPIQQLEARNVVDGRKLAAQMRSSGQKTYPFGVADLPSPDPDQLAAINRQASDLLDLYDAIADLALAEGVHQAVQGNFDRVGATLDAYGNASFPPDPEVVQTPATGIGITHRVAVHLRPGLVAPAGARPRAVAEPAVESWLRSVLPPLGDVGCVVTWKDPIDASAKTEPVTLGQLGLSALDVVELVKPDDVQAMAELDDRVLRHVWTTAQPRVDADLQIQYRQAPAGKLSVFEVSALVRSLRSLLRRSRPLRSSDATVTGRATPDQDAAVFVDPARVANPTGDLDVLQGDVDSLVGTLRPLAAAPDAQAAAIVAGVDGWLASAVDLLERASRFGMPECGWGFAYEWRRAAVHDLLGQVDAVVKRWNGRLTDFDARLAAYDALPAGTSDMQRFPALQAAEALVTAVLDPLPPTPAALRTDLDAKRAAFAAKRDALAAVLEAQHPSFSAVLAAVRAVTPIAAFDAAPFTLSVYEQRAATFVQDLSRSLTGLSKALVERRKATQSQLDAHAAATTPAARVDALVAGAKALLGESFLLVPEFAPSPAQAAEWANALQHSAAPTGLLHHLEDEGIDWPVEEWLNGAARVRPVLAAWETAVTLAGALGRPEPHLVPAQFPFVAGEPWLAMQFPDAQRPDSDRLLYTAHYEVPFSPTARQCGLVLDEWTEVIPGPLKDTGLTFNFDRPDNEPPQAILLVTPATADGAWHWEDVVGALNETLDLAKKRSLEPANLDPTAYARLLPATIMAVSLHGISITTILAAINGVLAAPEVQGHA